MVTVGWPDNWFKIIPGLLGLPTEKEDRNLVVPFVILVFIAAFVAVFLYSLNHGLRLVVNDFGFIGRDWSRHYGLTLLTSFFLHAGWMHLIGNSYYLYVFGDDVEDDLNRSQLVILIFAGHLSGVLLQVFLSGGELPIVGASAGVSALMGYYMVRFPNRRISYMLLLLFNAIWFHVPAYIALLWKFAWDFLLAGISMAESQTGSVGGVAHWAHLGGAIFGIFFAYSRSVQSKN